MSSRNQNRKSDKSARNSVVSVDSPRHEISNVGTTLVHRIVTPKLTSPWFTYQQIAVLKTPTGLLHAATDYYHGSLPTNSVFVISDLG